MRSGFFGWLMSTLRGEVSAADLQSRRGAGTAAYSLIEEAEETPGEDRSSRLFRVCAWNAFALETIAETMIEVDVADDPSTAGYVPPSTLQFANDCVNCVPDWIRIARIVQSDPDARVPGLPATLPAWRARESTRHGELHGLRIAYEALEARAASDLRALAASSHADARELVQLERVRTEMESAAEYANAISAGDAGPVDRGEARWRLLSALENALLLGQLIAMPTLIEVVGAREDTAVARGTSWLHICPGWPVLDSEGVSLGLVHTVRGDRETGMFDGVDVASGIASTVMHVPPAAISVIGAGELELSVRAGDLAR